MHLLRHGLTVLPGCYCGSTDVALSADGWAAMHAAVAGMNWSRIVSSPLQRCAGFAKVLAKQRAVPLQIDSRWRELHFGDWEARAVSAIAEHELAAFWRDPVGSAPRGAEPLEALRARVLAAYADVQAHGDDALVVTHGGPMRVLIAEARGWSLPRSLAIEVPHAALLTLPESMKP